ncbi:hypothetical protein RB195_012852 [Necator americanus]|uniref:Uncharacterized protein n=1 Tax=Necator americanus TaxID=51031 RepID=A0ABR1DUB2_NECAM
MAFFHPFHCNGSFRTSKWLAKKWLRKKKTIFSSPCKGKGTTDNPGAFVSFYLAFYFCLLLVCLRGF